MQRISQNRIGSLAIGQSWEQPEHGTLRVVVIDPDLDSVEAEDSKGGVILDTIGHFTTTWSLAS